MCRVDKETKAWIDNHPLSQSDLINYGLYLLRQMEDRLLKADVKIGMVHLEQPKEDLPF